MPRTSGDSAGRVTFMAHLGEIQEQLTAGHTGKMIWQRLTNEGKLTLSYDSFSYYVRKHFRATSVTGQPTRAVARGTQSENKTGFNYQSPGTPGAKKSKPLI